VEREVPTPDGKRIDLLVTGPEWVLVIENKLFAEVYNPLDSYEALAENHFGNRKPMFALLSRDGAAEEGWVPVTYDCYCAAINDEFSRGVFNDPQSKWHVFSRDFILHLENELYPPILVMAKDQIDFVEKNLRAMAQLVKLSECYVEFLMEDMQKRLSKAVPGYVSNPTHKEGWFAFRDQRYGVWDFHLTTPAHVKSAGKFWFTIWRKGAAPEEAGARDILSSLTPDKREGRWQSWTTREGFDERTDAVDALCRIAGELSRLWDQDTFQKRPASSSL